MLVEKKFINSVLTMLNLGCQWDVKGERSSRHCLYGSGANENGQEKESGEKKPFSQVLCNCD